jgi:hypothetical protein
MVRKLLELSKFLVFNSGTNSFGNNSIFAFYLLLFTLYRFLYLLFELLIMGLVIFLCLVYHCLLSTAHGMDQCEVSMTIPYDPMKPRLGSVIDSEPDTGVELMDHITLTSLCEDRLAATATLPIALLPIQNPGNPVWQQRLEAASNLKGPHFHAEMTSLVSYA